MYTLGTDTASRKAAKTAFVYLLISLFCSLFGAVYEIFSHGVYSFYMIYAFQFPLAGGVLPWFCISLWGGEKYPAVAARYLYHAGIATLTTGSILCGILEIYGTTNMLTGYYWTFGSILLLAGVTVYIFQLLLSHQSKHPIP